MTGNHPMSRMTSVLALSAALTAPSAQAVEWQLDDDTLFSVYGSLEPKLINETGDDGDDSFELDDEDSAVGIYAEHRFGPGLTAFGQLELEFSSDEGGSGNGAFDEQDSAFAGIKGDFGKVQAGNFDNVYEDLIIDATEVAEDAEITDEAVASEDNMIAYYSPSFGGFSFRTQVRIQGEDELDGVNDPDNEVGFAIAGGYTGKNFGVYAGYDDNGAEVRDAFDSSGNDTGNEEVADGETYGAAGVASFDPIEVAVKYSVQDNEDNDPVGDETEFIAGRGTFNYGPGDIYAAVQEVSPDATDNRTEFTVGADYKIFSNLKVWSEAGFFDREEEAGDNVMVGAIYNF
jgi:predicted porin